MKSKNCFPTSYEMAMFNRTPAEQINLRQKIVQYAQEEGNKPAARKYGCSVTTVRDWRRRFEKEGVKGLQNKSRAPKNRPFKTPKEVEEQIVAKRQEVPCFGPKRLKHFNPSLKVSEGVIYRVLKERGLLRKHRKKYQRKNDLRAVKAQYNSLVQHQEDVKHLYDIPYYWTWMQKYSLPKYEYTIRDVKSGFTVIAFAKEYNEQYSEILTETYLAHLESFGIDLKEVVIQTDNGSEFGARKHHINTPGFVNTIVVGMGAQHRYIPPGCSNANADVESFHATIEKELFDIEAFTSKEEFFKKVQLYQQFYNFVRPNFSKQGKTPWQIVIEDRPHIDPAVLNFPVYDLDALFRQKMEVTGDQYVHKLPVLFLIACIALDATAISYQSFAKDCFTSVHVLIVDPQEYTITAVKASQEGLGRETVCTLASRYGALAAINGGFWKLNGNLAGILKIFNQWYGTPFKPRGAIGWSQNGQIVLLDRVLTNHSLDDPQEIEVIPQSIPPHTTLQQWKEAEHIVGGVPVLVSNGKVVEDYSPEQALDSFLMNNYPRTAVGVKKSGKWVLLVVDACFYGLLGGMTVNNLLHKAAGL